MSRLPNTTVLGYPRARLLRILLGFPALGLALGFALPPLARWLDGASMLPLRDVLAFVGDMESAWQTVAFALAATLIGLLAAFVAVADSVKVTLTEDTLNVEFGDRQKPLSLRRERVAAVFVEGKDLVVLDSAGRPLALAPHRASRTALARAFRAHGYPWHDSRAESGGFDTAGTPLATSAMASATSPLASSSSAALPLKTAVSA
ncbi:hypothetical protein [Streptomyces sp. NPDC051561]|uniref:YqeB family protein n=1 Tax=Streptomyces sp. NPDC051561 TaxID=3365658 RepID=UPI0037A71A6F